MSKGFQVQEPLEVKVQICIRRLRGAIERQDANAVIRGLREMSAKYGTDVEQEALRQILKANEWMMAATFDRMPKKLHNKIEDISYGIMADTISAAGLRIEDHMRVSDRGFALTFAAIEAIKRSNPFGDLAEFERLGFAKMGNKTLEGVGIARDPFFHPLTEITDGTASDGTDQKFLNNWAIASAAISAAMGWLAPEPNNPGVAMGTLREFVFAASPTTELSQLMTRARYDDRSLMQLCSLANQGALIKFQAVN